MSDNKNCVGTFFYVYHLDEVFLGGRKDEAVSVAAGADDQDLFSSHEELLRPQDGVLQEDAERLALRLRVHELEDVAVDRAVLPVQFDADWTHDALDLTQNEVDAGDVRLRADGSPVARFQPVFVLDDGVEDSLRGADDVVLDATAFSRIEYPVRDERRFERLRNRVVSVDRRALVADSADDLKNSGRSSAKRWRRE